MARDTETVAHAFCDGGAGPMTRSSGSSWQACRRLERYSRQRDATADGVASLVCPEATGPEVQQAGFVPAGLSPLKRRWTLRRRVGEW
jgi:hypothetical protein